MSSAKFVLNQTLLKRFQEQLDKRLIWEFLGATNAEPLRKVAITNVTIKEGKLSTKLLKPVKSWSTGAKAAAAIGLVLAAAAVGGGVYALGGEAAAGKTVGVVGAVAAGYGLVDNARGAKSAVQSYKALRAFQGPVGATTKGPWRKVLGSSSDQEQLPAVASGGQDFLVILRATDDTQPGPPSQIWTRQVSNGGSVSSLARLDDQNPGNTGQNDAPDVVWNGLAGRYQAVWESVISPFAAAEPARRSPDEAASAAKPDAKPAKSADDQPFAAAPEGVEGIGGNIYLAEVAANGSVVAGGQAVEGDPAITTQSPQLAYDPSTGKTLVAYRYLNASDIFSPESLRGRLISHNAGVTTLDPAEIIIGQQKDDFHAYEPQLVYDPVHEGWLAAWRVLAWAALTVGPPVEVEGVNFQAVGPEGRLRGEREQYAWPLGTALPGFSLACPAPLGPRSLWLRFDDDTGVTRFLDSSGNQQHTNTCTTCPETGYQGQQGAAARFDGVDDKLLVSSDDPADLQFTQTGTLSAWLYPTGPGTDPTYGGVFLSNFEHYALYRLANGSIGWLYNNGSGGTKWLNAVGATVPLNQWSHVAVVYDNGLSTVYVNGVPTGTHQGPAGPMGHNNFKSNWIGGGQYNYTAAYLYLEGRMDEISKFANALSAAQVYDLYQGYASADSETCALVTNNAAWDSAPSRSLYLDSLRLDTPAPWLGELYATDPVEAVVQIDADRPTYALTSLTRPISDGLKSPLDVIYTGITGTVIIGGEASAALSGVGHVEVSVDDFNPVTWGQATGKETWAYAWQNPQEGQHTVYLRAFDAVGNMQPANNPYAVMVDHTPPLPAAWFSIADTITSSKDGDGRRSLFLSGRADDPLIEGVYEGSGVQSVEVRLEPGDNGWQTATLYSNGNWQIDYRLSATDGKTLLIDPTGVYTAFLRASDNVGNRTGPAAAVQAQIKVDNTAPLAELSYARPSACPDFAGDGVVRIDDVQAVTARWGQPASGGNEIYDLVADGLIDVLDITAAANGWNGPCSAGSGVSRYYAGWTNSPTPGVSQLTIYDPTAPGHHEQTVGEAQTLYAHVVAQDAYGNRTWQNLGPVYVDGPGTPDVLLAPSAGAAAALQKSTTAPAAVEPPGQALSYRGWMENQCNLVGANRSASQTAAGGESLSDVQRLYMTWDATALRLAWTGANWDNEKAALHGVQGCFFIVANCSPITVYCFCRHGDGSGLAADCPLASSLTTPPRPCGPSQPSVCSCRRRLVPGR